MHCLVESRIDVDAGHQPDGVPQAHQEPLPLLVGCDSEQKVDGNKEKPNPCQRVPGDGVICDIGKTGDSSYLMYGHGVATCMGEETHPQIAIVCFDD